MVLRIYSHCNALHELIKLLHAFFHKQHLYKQSQAKIGKKSSKC